MHGYICDSPASLVLVAQHAHQIDQLVRFFETWKQKILFQLFVIIFDETANNFGRIPPKLPAENPALRRSGEAPRRRPIARASTLRARASGLRAEKPPPLFSPVRQRSIKTGRQSPMSRQ